MDYTKIDAALAGALEEARDPEARVLPVFVHLRSDASAVDRAALTGLGPAAGPTDEDVRTAVLSPREVSELSEQAEVLQLRLSGRLRLLPEP